MVEPLKDHRIRINDSEIPALIEGLDLLIAKEKKDTGTDWSNRIRALGLLRNRLRSPDRTASRRSYSWHEKTKMPNSKAND